MTTVYGAAAHDRFCVWARTGDVTGDGIADVLVAADQEDAFGEDHAGGAYLLLGGAHLAAGGTLDLANLAAPALSGKVAHIEAPAGFVDVHLGGTVLIADLDGNSRGEVLVAATLNRITQTLGPSGFGSGDGQGGVPDGRVYILWDDSFATPWSAVFEFTVTARRRAVRSPPPGPDVARSNLGEDMLGGVDYDGDTEADLFVGDLTASDIGAPSVSGIGWVFYDADSTKGLSIDLDAPPGSLSITKIRGPSGERHRRRHDAPWRLRRGRHRRPRVLLAARRSAGAQQRGLDARVPRASRRLAGVDRYRGATSGVAGRRPSRSMARSAGRRHDRRR